MSKERILWMATRNKNKYSEAKNILSSMGVTLKILEVDRVEVQADDLKEIASYSLRNLESESRPIAVEDAGLFIDSLKGFPGPYSSYVLRTIGLEGVLKLMKNVENREAKFKSAVAYKFRDQSSCFLGVVEGEISSEIRGSQGFGYDPIFIPREGDGRTFGEMSLDEKNTMSHRAIAFRKLGEWLLTRN